MKTIKLTLLAFSALLLAGNISAQKNIDTPAKTLCGSAELNNQRLAQNPWIQDIIDDQNKLAKEYEANHISGRMGNITYIIPTVYHIIHDNGPENLSKATIEGSILSLNNDFQNLNVDVSQVVAAFTGIVADIEVEFRLAHIDPNGNCTEGITRTVSQLTYAGDEQLKGLVSWDTYKYYNIWVCKTIASGAGGYAYYPGWAPSQSQEGVVIRSDGTGRTLTHETGHYFNLAHTWGSSNTPAIASNCSTDDNVGDTPNCIGTSGCNTSNSSCSSLDNVQNHMEYASCRKMFTEGQKSRMTSAINSSNGGRNSLWTTSNLNATGTNNPYNAVSCQPVALFSNDKEYICEGDAVTFTDDSYNATPNGWNWTFTGGTPATSAVSNPTITYNTAGVYSVTHEPSSTGGTAIPVTKTNLITVSSLTAAYIGPFQDSFEVPATFSSDWWVNNGAGQGWTNTTSAAVTGTRAVRIRNHFTGTDGQEDELISPSYDISAAATKTMTFEYAFAKKNTADTDKMLVYYSTDCGATWLLKLPLSSSSIATASNSASEFVPSAGDWVKKSISLTSIGTATNVRFKFTFTSGGGSNIYIDDINIGDFTIGIDDFSSIASFSVYPNPTSSSAQISFNLTQDVDNLSIKVRNAVGQEVTNVINGQSFNSGQYTLKIDEQRKLSSGIYFVEFNADNKVKVQKLIVQ